MNKNFSNSKSINYNISVIIIFLFFILSQSPLFSKVINVPHDYAKIQDAINAAVDGDEIIVAPGTYIENINFSGNNIILRSTKPTDPSIVASTIINGNTLGFGVTFSGTELSTCILSGFTITNGYQGIRGNHTKATIQFNKIIANKGCGLCQCDGIVKNNIITDNTTHEGGGLYDCNGIICNNVIYNNYANYNGGGLYMCKGSIVNCIIWGNVSAQGAQYYDCITPLYSCIQNWSGTSRGNISSNPKFVNPSEGNFHLQSDSPCIDAGSIYYLSEDYFIDMDGECRVSGNAIDIGCDEYNSSLDTDGDLLSDIDEVKYGSDINIRDTDSDGLIDGAEVLRGTNPVTFTNPQGISIPDNFSKIQQGIFLSFPSEIVTVSIGTYLENLRFLGRNLVLQSSNPFDENIVKSTIIDGSADDSVATFYGTETEDFILQGFTICNGKANGKAVSGGGINGKGTRATIRYNNIKNNTADGEGGGIVYCDGIIEYNEINNNVAYTGGGIYGCNGIITHNNIKYNHASTEKGGGIANCGGLISNNTISNNSGGGLFYCNSDVLNNIISYNYGSGLSQCNGIISFNLIKGHNFYGLINCEYIIENNIISDNVSKVDGGGLYSCDGIIRNNVICNNQANGIGGGLYGCGQEEEGTIIQNNIIIRNKSEIGGGAANCNGSIINNIVCQNSATQYGGGLYKCKGFIENNTIWDNLSSVSGGGLFECTGTIKNCILWGNSAFISDQIYNSTTPTYSCIQDWISGGTGNISKDPKFIDPENNIFRLFSNSPCIDAGDPDSQYNDASIPPGKGTSRNDMGAYGGPENDKWAMGVIIVPDDYSTIQSAIDASRDGDEIIVLPGTYYENIRFQGKNIILRSTNPTDSVIATSTIIDGNHFGSVVTFSGSEFSNCILSGFTITNGYDQGGGGIKGNGNLATIQYNRIIGNGTYSIPPYGDFGGGIFDCDGIIQNNTISENFVNYAGGGLAYCDGLIQSNFISENRASHGGGLFSCDALIQNNLIFNNSSKFGGGIAKCEGDIINNTIYNNSADNMGGGIYECSGTIKNCIIWGNAAPTDAQINNSSLPSYCCIQDWTGEGLRNISENPELANPANGDFHLKSSSPCIDAGGEITWLKNDFEGDTRPINAFGGNRGDGSDYDIGADEFVSSTTNVKNWDLWF